MNRAEKEYQKARKAARQGKIQDQIAVMDLAEELHERVSKLATNIHVREFPEDFDHMYDSIQDVKDRAAGEEMLNQQALDEIKRKREEIGEEALKDGTDKYCWRLAKKEIYSDISVNRPPADTCTCCNQPIDVVGGRRIVARKTIGVILSNKKDRSQRAKDTIAHCIQLYDDKAFFLILWGYHNDWPSEAIENAKSQVLAGRQPWRCQKCARAVCVECGELQLLPMGSDILYGSGCVSHLSIFPVNPGCINPVCPAYREGDNRVYKLPVD